jgi:hypothetical protein
MSLCRGSNLCLSVIQEIMEITTLELGPFPWMTFGSANTCSGQFLGYCHLFHMLVGLLLSLNLYHHLINLVMHQHPKVSSSPAV